MKNIDLTIEQYSNLIPLCLEESVFHAESVLSLIPDEKKISRVLKVFTWRTGEVFSNKLYTLNELLRFKEQNSTTKLILPDALASVEKTIVGLNCTP